MEKLTIEELAPYLAHKLQCQLTAHTEFKLIQGAINEYVIIDRNYWHLDQIRPIMYPPSALIKPILEGGKIPIVELLKIKYSDRPVDGRYSEIEVSKDGIPSAWYKFSAGHDIEVRISFIENVPYWIIKQLYAWHFWLGDQSYFEKGLLIDKRTVK